MLGGGTVQVYDLYKEECIYESDTDTDQRALRLVYSPDGRSVPVHCLYSRWKVSTSALSILQMEGQYRCLVYTPYGKLVRCIVRIDGNMSQLSKYFIVSHLGYNPSWEYMI